MFESLIGKHTSELPTPCLLLKIDAVERNIEKMASFFSDRACKLRPHAKTHKLPWIAHRQIRSGAIGITCAKLHDARAFVKNGIRNVLISSQVVRENEIIELVGLSKFANITVCVDDFNNAEKISQISERLGIRQGVLVEVNVGINRCGVPPGIQAFEFVKKISKLKGLNFEGLMGYEGGLFSMEEEEKTRTCHERNNLLIHTKELIEKNGFRVGVVSAGGSNTYKITGTCNGITDIQPGSYVTMDDWNVRHGIDFEQAVTVLGTIISRPEKKRAVMDVGLKAISTDHGLPRIVSHAAIQVEVLNEEHGKLILKEPNFEIAVGDKIELVPSHGCTTVPLYKHYIALKGRLAISEMKIISGNY